MERKLRRGLMLGVFLATVGIVLAPTSYKDSFAATPYHDSWDLAGDLAEWQANTAWTHVEVVDTGGNPGGYLFTESTGDPYYAGACTEKPEFTGDYGFAPTIQISVDLKLLNGLENLDGIYLRFRYQSSAYNGWRYLLTNAPAMDEWNTYTVIFEPNWTDTEATSAGWLQESNSTSFSETMADVYTAEVRLEGDGPMSAGIDNFSTTAGNIIRVPTDYSTIQAAIDAASSGDTVLVADGTYTGTGNKNLYFHYGQAITVKSENGPEHCNIDCEGQGRGFYFYRNDEIVISGFTVRNGYHERGGGMYCRRSSPTIDNCIISDNESYISDGSDGGGGIYCFDSSPTIMNCTIIRNSSQYKGGGIYCRESDPIISNCKISSNTTGIVGGIFYAFGGGIYCAVYSDPIISNSTISDNIAHGSNSIYTSKGGGISYVSGSSPTITSCAFIGNIADQGGGIHCDSPSTITDCTIIGNTANYGGGGGIFCTRQLNLTNCIIAANTAGAGGGILVDYTYMYINNCTFFGNTDTLRSGGALFNMGFMTVTMTNCILWGDSPSEIESPLGPLTVTYCDIQGGYPMEGNIDNNPLFVNVSDPNPGNWDLHLQSSSPCIDAGTNSVELPDTDFEGDPRIIDGDGDGIAIVDMGADERTTSGFTPIGTGITVTLVPSLLVSFAEVTVEGYTSLETSSDNPGSGWSDVTLSIDTSQNVATGFVPSLSWFALGFASEDGIGFLGPYYDITTTATYGGDVTVSLEYDEADIPADKNEGDLRIFHLKEVLIDIKPGSDSNCINPDSGGRISVAILCSDTYDVNNIDPDTIKLSGVAPLKWSLNKDVNGDGCNDFLFHFSTRELNGEDLLSDGNTLHITGGLLDGSTFFGSDVIHLAGGPNCYDQQ